MGGAERRRNRRRVASLTITMGLLLVAAACSGGSGETTVTSAPTSTVTTPPSTTATTVPDATTLPPTTTLPRPVFDPLVIAVPSEPASLDAQAVTDRVSRIVTSNVFETLLARNPDGSLTSKLAVSVTPVDNTTWDVELRRGVTFHNGEPFNAESAVFSFNRILGDGFETTRRAFINKFVDVVETGEYAIRITTDGLDARMPLKLANIPMVPLGAGGDLATNPIGTGPYRFVSWEAGSQIDLAAFDGYWGDAPDIGAFSVRLIEDSDEAIAALAAGEVDLVPDITLEEAGSAPVVKSVPSTNFSYIQLNTLAGKLADPKVRVALNHAVDKEGLASAVYDGNATPSAAQNVSPGSLGFNPDLAPYPYDPELARSMLDDAGAGDLAISLYVQLRRFPGGEESANFVATQLEAIGVTVEVVELLSAEFREGLAIQGDEPGAFDAAYNWSPDDWLDSARLFGQLTCGGATSKHCDEDLDGFFRAALRTTDQTERALSYQAGWAQVNANPYAIFLLQQHLHHGVSDRVVWEPRLDDEYLVATMSLTA